MASRSLRLPSIDSADLFGSLSDDGARGGIEAVGGGGMVQPMVYPQRKSVRFPAVYL